MLPRYGIYVAFCCTWFIKRLKWLQITVTKMFIKNPFYILTSNFFSFWPKNEQGIEECETLAVRNCNVYFSVINDQLRIWEVLILLRHTLFWLQCFKCGHCPNAHLYIKCLVLNYFKMKCVGHRMSAWDCLLW